MKAHTSYANKEILPGITRKEFNKMVDDCCKNQIDPDSPIHKDPNYKVPVRKGGVRESTKSYIKTMRKGRKIMNEYYGRQKRAKN